MHKDILPLDDALFEEQGEIEAYRKVFRRLASATVLAAITDLSDKNWFVRCEAAYYLRHDGGKLLEALGIRCDLVDDLLANPPQRTTLKCSNGRRERVKLHGRQVGRYEATF